MFQLETSVAEALVPFTKVRSAWLFGSRAKGIPRSGSDLDVGLLMEHKPTTRELVDLQMALMEGTDIEHIDLCILNDASSILRFEALSGTNVLCRDPQAQAGFVSLTSREYEDDMAALERGFRYRKDSIADSHSS